MATELPVRVEFTLPEPWQVVPPDSVGADGAAFVALHHASADGFTANITMSGQLRDPEVDLVWLGDESLARFAANDVETELVSRTEVGTEEYPGLSQVLELDAVVQGEPLRLLQCQGYLSMPDPDHPKKLAVIDVSLTCRASQLDAVFADYQALLRDLRPAEPSTPR